MFISKLTPQSMSADDDHKLLELGIGFTNVCHRATRGCQALTKQEILDGVEELKAKIKEFRPKIAVFNGKGIYEVFSGEKDFYFGKQDRKVEGTDTVSQ